MDFFNLKIYRLACYDPPKNKTVPDDQVPNEVVIAANNELEARNLAVFADLTQEFVFWLDPVQSSCEEIDISSPIVISMEYPYGW